MLEEPIDVDIDEGDYVQSGTQMLNPSKRKMIGLSYQLIGEEKMQKLDALQLEQSIREKEKSLANDKSADLNPS